MAVLIYPTKVYKNLITAYNTREYTVLALQGGTRSSKTYSTLQLLHTICVNSKRKLLISVVSESLPHLKRGALRDFQNIMGISTGSRGWHATDKIFTYPNGCQIEFFSIDNVDKCKGPARDILFINECNGVVHEAAHQLMIRTRKTIFLDWNPQSKFWFHEKYQGKPDTWFNISTHWHNHHLEESIRERIERMKYIDREWYRVYGMGLVGVWKGKVFEKHRTDDLEEIFKNTDPSALRFGLDFGYKPDPCAFVMAAKIGTTICVFKEIVVDETTNDDLAEIIKLWCKDHIVWCDSASPDRIRSLVKCGINARGVGRKNREYSTLWLKAHEIVMDNDCKCTQKEVDEYSLKVDKNGEVLTVFQDKNDHCIDALRYAFTPDYQNVGEAKNIHLAI